VRPSFSVRTRITATVATLTALAMLLVGVLVHVLGVKAMHDRASDAVAQEFEEFRRLQREEIDPATGGPLSLPDVLQRFLERNVPDSSMLAVTYVGSEPRSISGGHASADQAARERFLRTRTYTDGVQDVLHTGGTVRLETATGEEVWVSSLPVRSSAPTGRRGALVVVTFFGQERHELATTMQAYALAALVTLLLVLGLAWVQAGRLLAPIRVLRSTAQDIEATDLSRRIPETGNDDVTELTRTVNGMLARLEDGFEHQRRFLDDVGHELRTPLTVLAGHLELMDPGDPAEVAAVRALLLDETGRMSRLVQDLVLLAKARRPDFLRPVEVDVDELTQDVLAKMRGLGERRWRLDRTAGGSAVLDPQRVTQALLQLADNAVKHTGEQDAVTLSSYRSGGQVCFQVVDTGAGIPAADRDRIFERFARAHVPDHDEGLGLGLSIVHAIATAHGGTVRLTDDEHTTFVLSIPAEEVSWPTS